jgi:hypothetical protein
VGGPTFVTVIRTVATKIIRATPERLMALYLDYRSWPRLFPATIRGVQFVGEQGGRIRLEVDHLGEGKVINVLTVVSDNEVRLDEWKPRYEATFINRFEADPNGTRYSVFAEVALRGLWVLLTPFASPVVRSRIRRYVLGPMKVRAEQQLPPPGSDDRGPPAARPPA